MLFVYLSISGITVSSVLIREENGMQTPVYYINRAFRGAEERYTRAEKMAFTLVVTARQLRPYFQVHTIRVLTDRLLKIILHKLKTSGRLVKWLVELSEFNIKYHPRGAIKGQTVMYFFAKYTRTLRYEFEAQEEQPVGKEPGQADCVV